MTSLYADSSTLTMQLVIDFLERNSFVSASAVRLEVRRSAAHSLERLPNSFLTPVLRTPQLERTMGAACGQEANVQATSAQGPTKSSTSHNDSAVTVRAKQKEDLLSRERQEAAEMREKAKKEEAKVASTMSTGSTGSRGSREQNSSKGSSRMYEDFLALAQGLILLTLTSTSQDCSHKSADSRRDEDGNLTACDGTTQVDEDDPIYNVACKVRGASILSR